MSINPYNNTPVNCDDDHVVRLDKFLPGLDLIPQVEKSLIFEMDGNFNYTVLTSPQFRLHN